MSLVVAIGVLSAGGGTPAAADVEIVHRGGLVGLRLTSRDTTGNDIVAAAKDAGIRVRVQESAVGASLVGRFIGWRQEGLSAGVAASALELLGADGDVFDGFVVDPRSSSEFLLKLGRPARAGEPYEKFVDATAPGEVLECESLVGLHSPEVAELASARGARLRWRGRLENGMPTSISTHEALRAPWKDLVVTSATASSAVDVIVDLGLGGAPSAGAPSARDLRSC